MVSIQVARYLMPEIYGTYQYLLSVSTAILLFLNLNTENAFFTFISKKQQHYRFYYAYLVWQMLQILLVFLVVFILNHDLYKLIFKDIEIGLVFICIGATFFLANIQNTSNHLIEAVRKTHVTQILNIFIALLHCGIVLTLIYTNSLDLKLLFQLLLLEYIFYAFIVFLVLYKNGSQLISTDSFNLGKMIRRFYYYCRPLFMLSIISFIYVIMDRWLIQTYVGASGQAYFSIAYQFTTLTILITSSVLRIFWKEISESKEKNNLIKTQNYFIVVSENLFLFTCCISSMLFFYSQHVLEFFYTDDYLPASLVFKIMMLYPIFQSMGQLYSVYLLSVEKTKLYSNISIGISIVSIITAIFFMSDFGLKLGAEGIAIKLILSGIVSMIILEYSIRKSLGIENGYKSKAITITFCFIFSATIYLFFKKLEVSLFLQAIFITILYIIPVSIYMLNNFKSLGKNYE